MTDFGTSLSKTIQVEYIKGIKRITSNNSFSRRPINYKNAVIPRTERAKIYLRDGFKHLSDQIGIPFQFVIVCLNLGLLIIIPAPFIYLSYSLVMEKTLIQEDFHGEYYHFGHLLNPSKKEPWWSEVPNVEIFFFAQIFTGIYLFFGLFELVSFYAVGYENNGKYLIKRSRFKKLIQYPFYFCIGVCCFIYLMYIVFVLVWWILGAVMNPAKYLPYASASATLVVFVMTKF
jgi:hypothetical protein